MTKMWTRTHMAFPNEKQMFPRTDLGDTIIHRNGNYVLHVRQHVA